MCDRLQMGTTRTGDARKINSGAEAAIGNPMSQHYWMTDKAGHLCRFTKVNKCNTLKSTDYKDPPVILTRKSI